MHYLADGLHGHIHGGDLVGAAEAEYISKGKTDKVKGAYLKHILAAQGITVEDVDMFLS